MRLDELLSRIDATVDLPVGQTAGSIRFSGAFPPHEATSTDVTMVDSVDGVTEGGIKGRPIEAAAVITPVDLKLGTTLSIVCSRPHEAFAEACKWFRPPVKPSSGLGGIDSSAGIDPTAVIHPMAIVGPQVRIGPRTHIGPGVVIMDRAQIGADCMIGPNVTIYEYSVLGDDVWLHAGVVIGAYGFGYRREADRQVRTAQLGYVHIEDDVEIGAAATVDRGTYGTTRIGKGTKIDNQVMVAHNCQIGKRNLICSQVGIAGSCRTGDDVILAGQVGLKDHIELGDGTIVGAQAGVMDDLPGNDIYLGSPATTQRDQMQIMAVQRRLPEMRRELKSLRRQLADVDVKPTAKAKAA